VGLGLRAPGFEFRVPGRKKKLNRKDAKNTKKRLNLVAVRLSKSPSLNSVFASFATFCLNFFGLHCVVGIGGDLSAVALAKEDDGVPLHGHPSQQHRQCRQDFSIAMQVNLIVKIGYDADMIWNKANPLADFRAFCALR
jgi:hypothetical protein